MKSPFSVHSAAMSRIDRVHAHEKAELILESFRSILQVDSNLAKFSTALPSPRVLLLLLGSSPSPTAAAIVLNLAGLHLAAFANFSRKLELAQFWAVLKVVLPKAWDSTVHAAAFDLLFGRVKPVDTTEATASGEVVKFQAVLPVIFACLELGLSRILERTMYVGEGLRVHHILGGKSSFNLSMHFNANFPRSIRS